MAALSRRSEAATNSRERAPSSARLPPPARLLSHAFPSDVPWFRTAGQDVVSQATNSQEPDVAHGGSCSQRREDTAGMKSSQLEPTDERMITRQEPGAVRAAPVVVSSSLRHPFTNPPMRREPFHTTRPHPARPSTLANCCHHDSPARPSSAAT
jgi:hypothetical protein